MAERISCLNCGEPLLKHKRWARREKKFCNDDCRTHWHLKEKERKKYEKLKKEIVALIDGHIQELGQWL